MAQPGNGAIDIANLPIQQLNMLRKKLTEEVQQLMQNYQVLGQTKVRYVLSKKALANGVKKENDGKDVLVPLTQSLYVPGKIHDEALVDIGTGYYVSRTSKQAQEFMDRKIQFLEQRLAQLQKVILTKQHDSRQVTQMLQQKVKLAAAAGPAAGGA
eukprot:g4389.t1